MTLYYSGDQFKKNVMGGACSIYGGRGEVHTGFWCRNLREGDHLEEPRRKWADNVEMDLWEVGPEGHGLD